MLKNVAGQKVGAQLITAADGTPFTGSVTVAVTVDAGTQATGSVGSGACAHEGGGYHTYAPAQAETNGDLVAFTFSGTGAISVTVQVYTLPATGILAPATAGRTLVVDAAGLADANVVKLGPTGSGTAQTARDIGASVLLSSGTGTGQVSLSSGTVTTGAISNNAITAASIATGAIDADAIADNAIDAGALATDAVNEIRNAITNGAYALDTDANGRIRVVDGTGAGEINTNSGAIALVDLVTLATTVTNLTNAATSGDLTATMKASVNTEADAAIETYHLDHLLAVAYDPASKPGAADALLNELVESDSGVSRFTANALEQAPSGTGASAAAIVQAMFDTDSGETAGSAVAGSAVYEIINNAGGGSSDWTADQRTAIAAILGIPGSGTTPADPSTGILDTIRDLIAALNDLSSAEAQAAGEAALAAYDAPTNTELDAAIATLPTQAEITGGAYALDTDANGRVRIVDGTGTGELNTSGGFIAGIAGTLNTLDALDTAQDSQHATTQAAVTASAIRTALGLGSANLDTQLGDLPTAAENAAALLDLSNGIETGITPRQALRGIAAKAAGLISGAGTGTEVVKGIGQASGGTTRLTATVDGSGNISAWTLNL